MTDPGGVNRWVLTQQQHVSWTGPVPLHIKLLQSQSLLIGDQAQADHLHHRPAALHPALQRDQKTQHPPTYQVRGGQEGRDKSRDPQTTGGQCEFKTL